MPDLCAKRFLPSACYCLPISFMLCLLFFRQVIIFFVLTFRAKGQLKTEVKQLPRLERLLFTNQLHGSFQLMARLPDGQPTRTGIDSLYLLAM
ncbi:unnamed protein product [Protopolystoma xenopodis]|uniref:Uncharacterized protein n=1 Tax=Protopolystoma xenopodis TaxID=117903 RepID=A0A448XIF1_9PLAT|nr:unnamed protein product [Protopolystoma xenopodis]